MLANVAVKPEANSCCQVWKDKYTKLEEKRNALRQAVKLLEQQINKIQAENLNLKKAHDEERAHANIEKEEKEKVLGARISLEDEISVLKSEISSLQQKKSQHSHKEIELLQTRISEGEGEICRLKDLLEAEKRRADSEKKNAEMSKKEAAEAWKIVKAKKNKAEDLRRSIEVEKAKEHILQMEMLKKEVDETKLKLASESLRLQDTSKKLEAERQKAIKESKRADSEMSKSEHQRMLAEVKEKMAEEERNRAENLIQQLEEKNCRVDELQKQILEIVPLKSLGEAPGSQHDKKINAELSKRNERNWSEISQREADEPKLFLELPNSKEVSQRIKVDKHRAIVEKNCVNPEINKAEKMASAEINLRKTMADKSRDDWFSCELQENKRKIEELQKRMHGLMSSRRLVEASTVSYNKAMGAERERVKLLKKKIKFEKMKAQHAKQVAELEKSRNMMLKQELERLKLEFVQSLQRLDVLHKFFPSEAEGIDDQGKTGDVENVRSLDLMKKPCGTEQFQASPDIFKLNHHHPVTLLHQTGGSYAASVTGIDSELEPLLGGSNRQMLHSCAIDSSTASFSDGQLVGSQEKGVISFTTSGKFVEGNINTQTRISNLSGQVPKTKCIENIAMVAENSVRSPVRTDGNRKKRKALSDTIESIEYLYSESKKLHKRIEERDTDALNRGLAKPLKKKGCLLHDVQENRVADRSKYQKKRKACNEEESVRQNSCGCKKMNSREVGNEFCRTPNGSRLISQARSDFIEGSHACREGFNDSVTFDNETLSSFENVADEGYMELLKLDNAADEERYMRATEVPLSPSLPEIVLGVETCELDTLEPLVERSCEGLPDGKETQLHSNSYCVIDSEIKSNIFLSKSPVSFHDVIVHDGGLISSLEKAESDKNDHLGIVQVGETTVHGIQGSDTTVVVTCQPIPSNDGAKFVSEIDLEFAYENIPRYFVLFSDMKDDYSVASVFSATRTCMARCCSVTQKEWALQEILLALKMEGKLFPREKACAFFSLLLANFCTAASDKFGNILNWGSFPCLDTFVGYIYEVMSDVEIRRLIVELVFFDELLLLIEDFLVDGRVLLYHNASFGRLIQCDKRMEVLVDGVNEMFSIVPASAYHLVAGSILLASISAAIDRIGFLCEVSFNILRKSTYDSSMRLTILHIFAYTGRDKFFTMRSFSLLMTVLKSIVSFLENSLSDDAALCPSLRNVKTEFCRSADCPFLENVVSIHTVALFLLGLLQKNVLKGKMHVDVEKSINPLSSGMYNADDNLRLEEICSIHNLSCDDSCCLNKFKVLDMLPASDNNMTLCDLSDTISLLEVLACYMSWGWTSTNVVPELLKMLESSSATENLTATIVILLGQLGRFGVNSNGYEDKGVENLRSKLSAFLRWDTAMNAGLPIQVATVSSLLCLLPFDFETIIQDESNLSSSDSLNFPVASIKKWFSSLNQKQQQLSFSLLQTADAVSKS